MTDRTVRDVGEFGLIDRISSIVGSPGAVVGIGDDAAVLDQPGSNYLLATVDMLVEGVHFPAGAAGIAVGRRAMAINLSDVAAMGGTPTAALTSLALPPDTLLARVEQIYHGLSEEAKTFGVAIVGGNVTRTPGPLSLDVVLFGTVAKEEVVLRSGAQAGDVLAVTGVLGREAARRMTRDRAGSSREKTEPELSVPEPRVAAGRALASGHLAHAMLDVSDGLGSDLYHLARASEVGAVVYEEALPIALEARTSAAAQGVNPLDLALFGGEDYELLIAVAPDAVQRGAAVLGSVPLYSIGTVLPVDQGVLIEREGGRREPLRAGGWRHF